MGELCSDNISGCFQGGKKELGSFLYIYKHTARTIVSFVGFNYGKMVRNTTYSHQVHRSVRGNTNKWSQDCWCKRKNKRNGRMAQTTH